MNAAKFGAEEAHRMKQRILTKEEVLKYVSSLDPNRRLEWLVDLGSALTIAARGGSPLAAPPGNIDHLVAFNEMQHQLFNYLRHCRRKDDRKIEDLVQGLVQRAISSSIEGEFMWALKSSLKQDLESTTSE